MTIIDATRWTKQQHDEQDALDDLTPIPFMPCSTPSDDALTEHRDVDPLDHDTPIWDAMTTEHGDPIASALADAAAAGLIRPGTWHHDGTAATLAHGGAA
jgi:hypothetical protein